MGGSIFHIVNAGIGSFHLSSMCSIFTIDKKQSSFCFHAECLRPALS